MSAVSRVPTLIGRMVATVAALAALVVAVTLLALTTPSEAQDAVRFSCSSAAGELSGPAAVDRRGQPTDTYFIYRSTDGGSYQWLGSASGQQLAFRDPAPRIGARYRVDRLYGAGANCATISEPSPVPCAAAGEAIEAEDAVIAGRFETVADPAASNGSYVAVPRGTGGERQVPRGHFVEFCVTVTEPGSYRIDAAIMAVSDVKRSFFVNVDNSAYATFVVPASVEANQYRTVVVNDDITVDRFPGIRPPAIGDPIWNLDAGDHYVRFSLRRDGTRLDAITLNPSDAPLPQGPACPDCDQLASLYETAGLTPPSGDPCRWRNVTCETDPATGSNRIVALDLQLAGISALPSEIGNLTNLRTLDLRRVGLTSLPPEIGRLTNVEVLLLNNNRLTALPSEIGDLSSLQELQATFNDMTTLPPEIGGLTNLRTLNVTANPLTSLPAEIGQLTNLTNLRLGSDLQELPPEIGELTSLTNLFLFGNNLTTLPPEIGNLANLTNLDLRSNGLRSLPPEIGNLANLVSLSLDRNALSELPPEIGELTNLVRLTLVDNRLTSVPAELGDLTALRFVILRNNQLRGDVTALARLDLDRIGILLDDGPGGNDCLTTTSDELAAFLDEGGAWDACENP